MSGFPVLFMSVLHVEVHVQECPMYHWVRPQTVKPVFKGDSDDRTPCMVGWSGHPVWWGDLDTLYGGVIWTPCMVGWSGHPVWWGDLDTLHGGVIWTPCMVGWSGHPALHGIRGQLIRTMSYPAHVMIMWRRDTCHVGTLSLGYWGVPWRHVWLLYCNTLYTASWVWDSLLAMKPGCAGGRVFAPRSPGFFSSCKETGKVSSSEIPFYSKL